MTWSSVWIILSTTTPLGLVSVVMETNSVLFWTLDTSLSFASVGEIALIFLATHMTCPLREVVFSSLPINYMDELELFSTEYEALSKSPG